MISKQDAADLQWYLTEGISTFERSSFGAMLERAAILSVDSSGERIPPPDRSDWRYPPIKHETSEPSYTPDLDAMIRAARVSRRLASVERASPLGAAALSAYYGDIGFRWALTPLGRIAALYALTRDGRKHVERESAAGEYQHIRPDDRVAMMVDSGRNASSQDAPERQAWLRIDAQAKKILRDAWQNWQRAGAKDE